MSKLHVLDPALNSLDGELAYFITGLIEQNAELAEKLKHIDSLAELAEKTVIEASKEAVAIKAAAKIEANVKAADIVAGAEGTTQAAEHEVVAKAKKRAEAKRIIAESRQRSYDSTAEVQKKAEGEALLLRKEAEQLLASKQQTAKSLAAVSQQICVKHDSDETIKAACIEGYDKAAGLLEPDAAVRAPGDVWAEETTQDTSCAEEEGDEKESPGSYGDFVDMVLAPPLAFDPMLKLYRQLNRNPGVKVIGVKGSLDKGLWIRFIVRADTPLLSVFEALAELDRISYTVIEVGKVFSTQR